MVRNHLFRFGREQGRVEIRRDSVFQVNCLADVYHFFIVIDEHVYAGTVRKLRAFHMCWSAYILISAMLTMISPSTTPAYGENPAGVPATPSASSSAGRDVGVTVPFEIIILMLAFPSSSCVHVRASRGFGSIANGIPHALGRITSSVRSAGSSLEKRGGMVSVHTLFFSVAIWRVRLTMANSAALCVPKFFF